MSLSDTSRFMISGFAQGTTYNVSYYSSTQKIDANEIDSIFRVIDESMSIYNKNSLISQFNHVATSSIQMDRHMAKVLRKSEKIYKKTKGYFDVTIYPLMEIWGFGIHGVKFNPNPSQLDSVKKVVGFDKIKIKKNRLSKLYPGVAIDLNGIAQGYTVDVISSFLINRGIKSFIVEVGGEIFTSGVKPNNQLYKIEIQRPFQHGDENYQVVLRNQAITTSGSYEKYRFIKGERVSHHINPFTGYPIKNSTLSVTVIANTAMEADALDNYLMYLSPMDAISFVEKCKNVEVYLLYDENNTIKELQSSGFNNYIYKNNQPL